VNILKFILICRSARAVCLYEIASFISHSCIPNAIAIQHLDPPHIEVVACFPIKKGDAIIINYDYKGVLRPKLERRKFLSDQYHFLCKCGLCSDPTDGGQMLEAVTCVHCKLRRHESYLIPMNPLMENTPWRQEDRVHHSINELKL
jgi:hypothetical protein